MANKWADLFRSFDQPSDRVIDSATAKEIVAWADRDDLKASEVKDMLDRIVCGGLSNDFVVRVLDIVWNDLLKQEQVVAQ